jgi:DNA processing protein
MVVASDLRLGSAELNKAVEGVMVPQSSESSVEHFASIAWSVICEPGDAFAGLLIDTFGAATALSHELERLTAGEYVSRFSDAGADPGAMQAFGRFEQNLADARERWGSRMTMGKVMEAIRTAQAFGSWFISPESEMWPVQVADLGRHTPRGFWGLGDPGLLKINSFSFVGSRMATAYGELATAELVGPLVERGFAIVSGGAYGIDAMAHRATLALDGATVAVMAGGIDRLYPSGNADLFSEIRARGCLATEMPPGAEPTKWRFLQRNRIIAALGQATVVVEAHPKSGAVSTANRAMELGRPLGAVPGPLNSSGSDGCHRLIRDVGAELITCAQDILALVGQSADYSTNEIAGLGALETRVRDVIGHRGANLELICSEGGLTRSEAQIGISGLLLAGMIEQNSYGWQLKH